MPMPSFRVTCLPCACPKLVDTTATSMKPFYDYFVGPFINTVNFKWDTLITNEMVKNAWFGYITTTRQKYVKVSFRMWSIHKGPVDNSSTYIFISWNHTSQCPTAAISRLYHWCSGNFINYFPTHRCSCRAFQLWHLLTYCQWLWVYSNMSCWLLFSQARQFGGTFVPSSHCNPSIADHS